MTFSLTVLRWTSNRSIGDAAAEFVLAFAPVAAVPARAERASPMWQIHSISDCVLHHRKDTFDQPSLIRSDFEVLLDQLGGFSFRNSVEPAHAARAGSDHYVRCQLQTILGRDAVRSAACCLAVDDATLCVKQVDETARSDAADQTFDFQFCCSRLY